MSPVDTHSRDGAPTEQIDVGELIALDALPAPTGVPVVVELPPPSPSPRPTVVPLGIDIALDPMRDPGAPRWAAPADAAAPDADPDADPDRTADAADVVTDPRFIQRRERVAADRRRRRQRRSAWMLAGVGVVAAAVGVAASPLLDVDRIEIIGSSTLTLGDVADAGLATGDAMVLVDVAEVADRLRSDPRFVRVAVAQRYPGEVSIRVTDRPPIARVVGPARSLLVAEGGVIIREGRDDDFIQTVRVDRDPRGRPGGRLSTELAEAVDVVRSLPTELAFQVTSVRITDSHELVFELGDDRVLLFGTVTDADRKLTTAATMLGPQVDLRGVCQVDVRVPSAPTMRRNPSCDPPPPPPTPTDVAVVDPAAAGVDASAGVAAPDATPTPTPTPTTAAPPTTAPPPSGAGGSGATPLQGADSRDELLTDEVPDAVPSG